MRKQCKKPSKGLQEPGGNECVREEAGTLLAQADKVKIFREKETGKIGGFKLV